MHGNGDSPEDPRDDPPRRAVLIGLLFIVVLAVGGYVVITSMIHMARLQDCAVTGRTGC